MKPRSIDKLLSLNFDQVLRLRLLLLRILLIVVFGICVNAKSRLSLQRHLHRAEHWVVVSGEAIVHCDGKEITLSANQSTYIPVGASHRLENSRDEPLFLIEVQSGNYLGEDDIERIEDDFARK